MGFKVDIDFSKIESKLANITDDKTMLEIHNALARYCDPYVPMQEGMLTGNLNITPEYVQYNSPYAHYQYTELVYGPNIPVIKNGEIVGYWSPPNKHPTGAQLNHNVKGQKHALASSHWDKRMMEDKGDEFTEEVGRIIKDRLKEG
ncbi:MAG: hypothetical protein J1F01_05670 [Oscillospiraceae bacterium]|nr:hypothetical protein [Oscillospiraceae bacterium]